MRSNTIISRLTNENYMIKIKYNELYEKFKKLEEKLENSHIDHPLCPCSRPSLPTSINSNTNNNEILIQILQNKILELNKQIIEQNKISIGC
jgi:hypothetical protein